MMRENYWQFDIWSLHYIDMHDYCRYLICKIIGLKDYLSLVLIPKFKIHEEQSNSIWILIDSHDVILKGYGHHL